MNTYGQLVESLHHGVDPWLEFLALPAERRRPLHFAEWGSGHPWFSHLVDNRPSVVVEVGSFLGGSAIRLAGLLEAAGLPDSVVLCVDTWLAEEVLWSRPQHLDKLRFECGRPNFYMTFLANVADAGHQRRVLPLPMPSQSAARYLAQRGVRAGGLYIDGCHVEGDVLRDLDAYWELLEPGGSMLVDDYAPKEPEFAGLVRDVARFAHARRVGFKSSGRKAMFLKA